MAKNNEISNINISISCRSAFPQYIHNTSLNIAQNSYISRHIQKNSLLFFTSHCKDGRFYMAFLICRDYTAAASFKVYFIDGFYFPLFQTLPSIQYKKNIMNIFLCLPHQRFLLIPLPFPAAGKKIATSQLPILPFLYWEKCGRQEWKQKQRGCWHSPAAQCQTCLYCPALSLLSCSP